VALNGAWQLKEAGHSLTVIAKASKEDDIELENA